MAKRSLISRCPSYIHSYSGDNTKRYVTSRISLDYATVDPADCMLPVARFCFTFAGLLFLMVSFCPCKSKIYQNI